MTQTQPQTQQDAQQLPTIGQKREVMDKLMQTGIAEPSAESVADLLSQDYMLGRIRDADREYARLMARNIVHYVECDHPPQSSMVQGTLGMALREDLNNGATALSHEQKTKLKSTLLAMFFRTSRSVDGWQQDKLSEQIQTRRVEDDRDDDGPLGGLFS